MTPGGEGPVVAALEAAGPRARRVALGECCGSRAWVEEMLRRWPAESDAALIAAAEAVWWGLEPDDWREALRAHRRLGEADGPEWDGRVALRAEAGGDEETWRLLERRSMEYEERFGHIFVDHSSGMAAGEAVARIESRLLNDPETEIRVAAGEQARITRHRLAWLGEHGVPLRFGR